MLDISENLEGISSCVWGACKAVGVAKESIPLSPRAKVQRQADSEVLSMGAIPERLWFDRECERSS